MATVNNFKEDRDVEVLIKIFRREVDKEGILNTVKNRRYFKKDSQIKHEKKKKLQYKFERKKKLDKLREKGYRAKKSKKHGRNENKGDRKGQAYT